MALILDKSRMHELGAAHAERYATAAPFPRIAIDDFLPVEIIEELQTTFPGPEESVWGSFDNKREVKLALRDEELMPEPQLRLLRELNGQAFLEFLTAMTGMRGLVPDPAFYGGGLHQIRPGGMLKVHADFNLHPVTNLQRRLNALLYLNDDWDPSYGGNLELWDEKMTGPVEKIAPLANRLVVFSTTSTSFHGHPDPLACPPDRTRRSMAWYYYTLPEGKVERHSTLFQERPGEELYTKEELRRRRREVLVARARSAMPEPVASVLRSVKRRIKA